MTVKELIEILSGFEPDRIVVMASDAEGNSFSPIEGAEACRYHQRSGEIGLEELSDKLRAQGYTDEDVMMKDGESAVVLWPSDVDIE